MSEIEFSKLPKPRSVYIFCSAEELEAAAERTLLRVKAAEMAGNLACKTEVKTVRSKKMTTASWSSDKVPDLHFFLTDLRRHDGWLALMQTQQQQKTKAYGVRTYLFSGSGAILGAARLADRLIDNNLPATTIEKELFISEMFVGRSFANPPLSEDALAISSALALVPALRGGVRRMPIE